MNKGYIQKVAALSVGKGGAALVGIIVSIIMARVLSKADVALYRQVLLAFAFFVPILELGGRQGLYYFLPVEKTRKQGRIMDALVLFLITGGVYSLVILLGGNHLISQFFNNPRLSDLCLWLIPMALLAFPSTIQEPSLVSHGEVRLSAFVSSFRQLLIGASSIAVLYFFASPELQLISYVSVSSLSGIVIVFLVIRRFGRLRDLQPPTYSGIKELLLFSVPIGASLMVGVINLHLDKLLVGSMFEADRFAEYVLGSMEIPFISIITGSVSAVMIADIRRYAESGKLDMALDLFRMAGVASARLLFPITALLFVVGEALMVSLYGEKYAVSAMPFRVYLFLVPIRIVLFSALMVSLGEGKKIFRGAVWALVSNVILSLIFLKLYGTVGAAVATVSVAIFVTTPYNLRVIMRKTNCRVVDLFDFTRLTKIALLTVPPAIITYFLLSDNSLMNLILSTILFMIYYAAIYHKVIFKLFRK